MFENGRGTDTGLWGDDVKEFPCTLKWDNSDAVVFKKPPSEGPPNGMVTRT